MTAMLKTFPRIFFIIYKNKQPVNTTNPARYEKTLPQKPDDKVNDYDRDRNPTNPRLNHFFGS